VSGLQSAERRNRNVLRTVFKELTDSVERTSAGTVDKDFKVQNNKQLLIIIRRKIIPEEGKRDREANEANTWRRGRI